jgi:hypothetical protein
LAPQGSSASAAFWALIECRAHWGSTLLGVRQNTLRMTRGTRPVRRSLRVRPVGARLHLACAMLGSQVCPAPEKAQVPSAHGSRAFGCLVMHFPGVPGSQGHSSSRCARLDAQSVWRSFRSDRFQSVEAAPNRPRIPPSNRRSWDVSQLNWSTFPASGSTQLGFASPRTNSGDFSCPPRGPGSPLTTHDAKRDFRPFPD